MKTKSFCVPKVKNCLFLIAKSEPYTFGTSEYMNHTLLALENILRIITGPKATKLKTIEAVRKLRDFYKNDAVLST